MAAYADPRHRVTFYEIDPSIRPIAQRFFTFLPRCGLDCEVVIGDGRLEVLHPRVSPSRRNSQDRLRPKLQWLWWCLVSPAALLSWRCWVRSSYQIQSDVLNPVVTQHALETVRGHMWEYPLIATYHFGSGSARTYAGGGLSFGANGHYTAGFFYQSTTQLASGPVTTTSFEQRSADLSGLPTGYYLVGGVDGRISYFSIRPEFRYSHFPKDRNSNAETILNPNQFEFLVGISIHPFRVKK